VRMIKLVSAIIICLVCTQSHAAQGNLLFQCGFDGAGSNPSEVWHNCDPTNTNTPTGTSDWVSIVDQGCVSGKCYKLSATTTYGTYIEPWFPMTFNFPGTATEITTEFYEKFSKNAISGSNIKSARQIHTSNGLEDPYIFAAISAHSVWSGGTDLWQIVGEWTNATATKYSSKVNGWLCDNGGETNTCISKNSLHWKTTHLGTTWKKYRWYLKMPTNSSTSDGELWCWINDELMFKVTKIQNSGMAVRDILRLTWEPVLGTKESVDHYYDEIRIWEGFVPPTGFPTGDIPTDSSSPPKPPTSLSIK